MNRLSHNLLNRGAAKPIILAGVVGLCLIAGIVAYMLISHERTPSTHDLPPAVDTVVDLPIKWSEHNEESSPLLIMTGERGPVLKRDALSIDLGLYIDGASDTTWETSRAQDTIIVKGETMRGDVPLTLRWIFKANDPQVTLLIDMHDVPIRALSEPISASLSLPEETSYQAMAHTMDVQRIGAPITLGSWTPGWLKAVLPGDEGATLTFSEWNVTALRIAPDAAEKQLTFSLWDPGSSPSFEACEQQKLRTITLRQHVTMTIGERLALVPSRYEGGYRAAIAPLFIDPASHDAKSYKDGRARSAQDWISRSKTLLYGHSSEQDPRFGNGGLLGLGLGADIAMEPAWHDAPETRALSAQLANSKARQLTRDSSHELVDGEGVLLDEPDCELFLTRSQPYLTLGASRSMDQLNILEHPPTFIINGKELARQLPNLSPSFASHLEVPQLSGRRQVLSDAVFSSQALEALIQERGLMVFATPLIATRNPLTPTASQALLEPERGGNWTLSEQFSRALTNVELLHETHELLVTSPTQLMSYWQHARQVRVLEMPDGSVAIINPLERPIEGFTLLAEGNLTPELPEEQEFGGTELVTARDGSSQTWMWWTLQPGTTRIMLSQDAAQSALVPVNWQVQD